MDQGYYLRPPTPVEVDEVLEAYSHHPIPGFIISSIEVVCNETLSTLFTAQKRLLNSGRETKFIPSWKSNRPDPWRTKTIQKLENLAQPYGDPDAPSVLLLPMWTATSEDVARFIFERGYGIGQRPHYDSDQRFFGQGIYAIHEAEYAFRCYALEEEGTVLLLNCVCTVEAFPVIHGDYLAVHQNAVDHCDSHFVPLWAEYHPHTYDYGPCPPNRDHDYLELIVFATSQILPRYMVKITPVAGKLLPHILALQMFEDGLQLLSAGNYLPAVKALEISGSCGYPCAQIRLHWLHSGGSALGRTSAEQANRYKHPSPSVLSFLRNGWDSESLFCLGWCFQNGLTANQDFKEAARCYVAAKDHAEALYHVAMIYSSGVGGVGRDTGLSIQYLQEASNHGHVHSSYLLYLAFKHGLGVVPDQGMKKSFKQKALSHPKLAKKKCTLAPNQDIFDQGIQLQTRCWDPFRELSPNWKKVESTLFSRCSVSKLEAPVKACFYETVSHDVQISRIRFIKNVFLQQRFEATLIIMSKQGHENETSPFAERFDLTAEKAAVLNRFSGRYQRVAPNNKIKVAQTWVGTSVTSVNAVCSTGLSDLRVTDRGFFGAGIYSTLQANYARVYAEGPWGASPNSPNAAGEHCLLLCWVVVGNVYPITRETDYDPSQHFSRFYHNQNGLALRPGFDSHCVCVFVDEKKYFQAAKFHNGDERFEPDPSRLVDEIVVKESSQILPYCIVYYKKESSPLLTPEEQSHLSQNKTKG